MDLIAADAPGVAGDFERRLEDLIPPAYRLALGMLQDPSAAEDAVQEAALRAWQKASRLRPGSDPLPWFLAIVANQCRSTRRLRWWSVLKIEPPAPPAPAVEEQAVRGADLRRELLKLSRTDRLVVILSFYLDMPLEDVARVAGLSLAGARGRLYRAIRKLRPGLELEEALR